MGLQDMMLKTITGVFILALIGTVIYGLSTLSY